MSEAKIPERWVLNASPLIVLVRVGHEDLLLSLTDQVVIPRAVAAEIEAGTVEDQAKQALATGRFAIVDTPSPSKELLAWDLGSSLRSIGFRLDDQTIQEALQRTVGEEWLL